MMLRRIASAAFAVCYLALPALAGPLFDLQAGGGVEWNDAAKSYTASGGATLKYGESTIRAATLTAFYGTSQEDILSATATGAVQIENKGVTASGAAASYTASTGVLRLSGSPRLAKGTQTLNAGTSIVFNQKTGQATATGGVRLVTEGRTLEAAQATAFFSKVNGSFEAQRVVASGAVRITTPQHTITATAATYVLKPERIVLTGGVQAVSLKASPPQRAQAEQATYTPTTGKLLLSGNVRITQGENTLTGNQGEADINTGLASLKNSSGRVRGRVAIAQQPASQ
jgi:lipopolysaccharide export system protein LptA